ncbi:hypothetical protein AAOE16_18165 [Ekhidna sp. MALMAid0563]|uniref:hypothetical protein n=1 Tax=Ekhidna sp. MALMAid0563 TaxID=3143937 RepID=UPI0032DEF7D6
MKKRPDVFRPSKEEEEQAATELSKLFSPKSSIVTNSGKEYRGRFFKPGQKIKSHDFPGLDRQHCFIEGKILSIDQEGGWLEVEVEFDSLQSKEASRVGDTVTVPIVTELDAIWEYERIELLS